MKTNHCKLVSLTMLQLTEKDTKVTSSKLENSKSGHIK